MTSEQENLKRARERYARMASETRESPHYWSEASALDFTAAIKQLMDEEGITQAELARRTGFQPSFISRVLGGAANMTLTTLTKFALAFDRIPRLWLAPKTVKKWIPVPISTATTRRAQDFATDSMGRLLDFNVHARASAASGASDSMISTSELAEG